MLDADFEFGTLAERTSKQPGKPGTQPSVGGYGSQARRTSTLTLGKQGTQMKMRTALFAFSISALSTTLVSAQPLTYVIYTNAAEFAQAVGNMTKNDFETVPVGTNCKNYDFGDFSTEGAALYEVIIEDENTHELHFNSSSYTQNMSVMFHNPIVAFGFDWRNTDNNDDMIRVDFDGIRYVLGAKDEAGFWGVVTASGVITGDVPFLFGDTPGGSGWVSGNLDNFRYVEDTPRITRIDHSGTNLVIEWSSNQTGLVYAVEWCADLRTNSWSMIQPTSQWWTANTIWTNAQETASSGFFRVKAKTE